MKALLSRMSRQITTQVPGSAAMLWLRKVLGGIRIVPAVSLAATGKNC